MQTPFKACPLCDSDRFGALRLCDCTAHKFYRPELPNVMRWMKCEACSHVFTAGYWTGEALALIFDDAQENQKPGANLERERFTSAKIVDRLCEYIEPVGMWLDVGCGNGSLLFTAAEYGFKPIGLDLRQSTVDGLLACGVEAHCVDIGKIASPEPITVISMCDVLEHMPDPKTALEAAHRLLSHDGALFVSCPVMGSPLWEYLDANQVNPYWGELEHYHNFTRQRLYALLEETGFVPFRYGVSERYRCGMEVMAWKA